MTPRKTIVKGIPFSSHVLIEVTNECNLQCRHCFTSSGAPLKEELKKDDWELVLNDLVENGFMAYTVSGGEPLLDKEKTLFIIDHLSNISKSKIYLFTNAFFLTDKLLAKLKPKINGICFSLDISAEDHNWLRKNKKSYSKTISAIKMAKKVGIPVFIQAIVLPDSLKKLDSFMNKVNKLKIEAVKFSQVDFYGRARSSPELLLSTAEMQLLANKIDKYLDKQGLDVSLNLVKKSYIKKFPEHLKRPSLHVLSNGEVYPWYAFPQEFILFKYPGQTLSKIEKRELHRKIRYFRNKLTKFQKYLLDKDTSEYIDYDNKFAQFYERG